MISSAPALTAGTEIVAFTDRPVTVNDIVRYQGASGDLNPIHHDPDFARRSGYESVFSVGMLAAGVLATRLADALGASNVRRYKVRWREMCWPGDVLAYRATVADVREVDGLTLLDLEGEVTRQTGAVHVQAWATFVLERGDDA
jgi:acyl dehydratase